MSDRVCVTGASGFIGAAIVRALLGQHYEVNVLVRPSSPMMNLEGLDVRVYHGDLLEPLTLRKALANCRYLIHAAAHYKLYNRPADLPYRINVEGTRNLLTEARLAGIQRVVYTSSVSTMGICPVRGIGDETTPLDPRYVVGSYKRSKVLAEEEALRWAAFGLDVVIVNPAAPVGTGDIKPTPTGRMILEYLRGKMFGYLDTGLNVIDVEDVAMGHVLALRKGVTGRRYILGNRNMTLREIFQMLETLCGIPAPRWKVPYALAMAAGWVSQAAARWTGKDPVATVDAVRMAKKKMFFDSSRAIQELGLPQSPVLGAFEKAVRWFYSHGYARPTPFYTKRKPAGREACPMAVPAGAARKHRRVS